MTFVKETEKLADKIASSEAICLYRPTIPLDNKVLGLIPLEIYVNCFAELLNYRFLNSAKGYGTQVDSKTQYPMQHVFTVIDVRHPMPPINIYKNIPENLLLAVDMGGLDRRSLKSAMCEFSKFSRCAVTSDKDFYKNLSFDVIPVKDEAGLVHVLFGATELLKEKLPPIQEPFPKNMYD